MGLMAELRMKASDTSVYLALDSFFLHQESFAKKDNYFLEEM
jgi:hypothetical protein